MTDATPSLVPAAPTAEEIESATRILMRAWSPGTLLPGDPSYDTADDGIDPDEYCGCGGTDEDGESHCNCGGGCVCDSCAYYRYARNKVCSVKGCGKTPAFRVVRFGLVDQHVQEPTEKGAVCPHPEGADHFCTSTTVYVEAGPMVQEFDYQPACSTAHAVQLRDSYRQHSQQYNRGDRDHYRLEAWTYTPHFTELPAPLPQLREHLRSAHDNITWAIRHHASLGIPDTWLDSVRRNLALAAWNARRELEQPAADDDIDDEPSTPVQEEPDWGQGPW
ncbi:hypothetical protein OG194_29805 [Streptomyces sp. NBC_01288]|uniref:hypothetical protein n=1 Tax=Streptomyces sp. NBC_01288 TaxID=2903814 RepID=UPI002E0DE1E3|nr:hypothetical protein OG194_29805 [Streptomyces sp. NBC_01288]